MTQWPAQSEAVVVLPARPLTIKRGRLICIYKVCWYSLGMLFTLGLYLQLSFFGPSLRLIGPPDLYLCGLNGLTLFLFAKAKWAIDEFRAQQQLFGAVSSRRRSFAAISKVLDFLFPYLFLWWINPLNMAVYPLSQVVVRETAEDIKERAEEVLPAASDAAWNGRTEKHLLLSCAS